MSNKILKPCVHHLLLPTDLEKLGCEFNLIGISVLDDETLKIPDGQYENPPNVKLDWSILHQFYWTNWDIRKEKLKSQPTLEFILIKRGILNGSSRW